MQFMGAKFECKYRKSSKLLRAEDVVRMQKGKEYIQKIRTKASWKTLTWKTNTIVYVLY